MRHNFLPLSAYHFHSKLTCLLLIGACLFCVASLSLADDESDQKKLSSLQKQIRSLQQELELDNKQKDHAVFLLKNVETEIAERFHDLRIINDKISKANHKLATLNQRRDTLQQHMGEQRQRLGRQVQAAYVLGKQEYVKLLLNQQNPSDVARMVVYYQYFNTSRVQRLNEISANIAELKNIGDEINDKTTRLQALRNKVIDDTRQLESQRKQRRQIVAKMASRLQDKGQLLTSLQRDEQHLKRLLNQLQFERQDAPTNRAAIREFARLKGNLPWPVKGILTARFGSSRNAGRLKWKGVVINTSTGNEIHAIADGQVVFADWLRGFGMMLIIDHGNGYMSLYGHNQQLHARLGDRVRANTVIATAGNSGGQQTSKLYFEIRHNGVPQNPAKWCKSLPTGG